MAEIDGIVAAVMDEIINNSVMLPMERDYIELTEAVLSKITEGQKMETISERATVIVQMAMQRIDEEIEDLDWMNGAPLPLVHRMDYRETHPHQDVRDVYSIQKAAWEDVADSSEWPLPWRVFFQQYQAVSIADIPEEVYRFACVAELFYDGEEDIDDWIFEGSETGSLTKVRDSNGEPVDPYIIGYIFSELYVPIMNLADRITQAEDLSEEMFDDITLLEDVSTIEDLFGGDL